MNNPKDKIQDLSQGTANATMSLLNAFKFRKPRLAICAIIAMVACTVLLIAPMDFVQKFAWLLTLGFTLGFLGSGAKHMQGGSGNLAVLMFGGSFYLLAAGIIGTPATVFAASALEDAAAPVIGAAMGYFITDTDFD